MASTRKSDESLKQRLIDYINDVLAKVDESNADSTTKESLKTVASELKKFVQTIDEDKKEDYRKNIGTALSRLEGLKEKINSLKEKPEDDQENQQVLKWLAKMPAVPTRPLKEVNKVETASNDLSTYGPDVPLSKKIKRNEELAKEKKKAELVESMDVKKRVSNLTGNTIWNADASIDKKIETIAKMQAEQRQGFKRSK